MDESLAHEKNISTGDRYGRVLFSHIDNKDISTPAVTIAMKEVGKWAPAWPHQKRAAIALTHDVDSIVLPFKERARHILKALRHGKFIELWRAKVGLFAKTQDPDWQFEHIVALENKYHASSSFYFMATEDHDKRYSIRRCGKIISWLESKGRDIGLHGGLESYQDASVLAEEKKRLEHFTKEPVIGIRQHYLRFDHNNTWKAQAEAGFLYDATLGYPDQIGFRSGAAHMFQTGGGVYEIPLALMDTTLDSYQGLSFAKDQDAIWQQIKTLLDEIMVVGGCASILWHTNRFNDHLHPGATEMYERILAYCAEQDVWLTSGANIYHHLTKDAS